MIYFNFFPLHACKIIIIVQQHTMQHSIAPILPKYRRYSVRIADTVSRYFFRYRVPSIGDTFFSDKSVLLVPILFILQNTVDGAWKFVPWYFLTQRFHQMMLRSLFSDHLSVQKKCSFFKLLYQSTGYRYRVLIGQSTEYRAPSTDGPVLY